jgi:hypothetical protein
VSAEAAALAGRTAAERTMLDTGTAKRPTGGSTYNPATQASVTAYADLFTDTPCKLQARGLVSTINEVGDRSATTIRVELHLPASTDPLTTGDVWEITGARICRWPRSATATAWSHRSPSRSPRHGATKWSGWSHEPF